MGMGLCFSNSVEEAAHTRKERGRSRDLDKNLQDQNTTDNQVNKLLLLGAGESGKSTLFKQMINIYGTDYKDEAKRKEFVVIIYNNIIFGMQQLIKSADEEEFTIKAEESKNRVVSLFGDERLDQTLIDHVKKLWEDEAIQAVYEVRNKYQIPDSAKYFFDRLYDQGNGIPPIAPQTFVPTISDVLRSRVRTTGIVEREFEIDSSKFRMFDVGGQKNERKKWIHCFENVTSVLFVGVLSEYNQKLYEDDITNRMEETIKLFNEIVNSHWFQVTNFILFLNKCDLFKEKIGKYPLNKECPLFQGFGDEVNTYEGGCEAIKDLFLSKNNTPDEREIYAHIVCATDTDMVTKLFNDIKSIIIRQALVDAGLVM